MAKWVILNKKTGKYVGKFKKDTDTNPLYFNTSKAAFTELGKRNLGPQYKVTERGNRNERI